MQFTDPFEFYINLLSQMIIKEEQYDNLNQNIKKVMEHALRQSPALKYFPTKAIDLYVERVYNPIELMPIDENKKYPPSWLVPRTPFQQHLFQFTRRIIGSLRAHFSGRLSLTEYAVSYFSMRDVENRIVAFHLLKEDTETPTGRTWMVGEYGHKQYVYELPNFSWDPIDPNNPFRVTWSHGLTMICQNSVWLTRADYDKTKKNYSLESILKMRNQEIRGLCLRNHPLGLEGLLNKGMEAGHVTILEEGPDNHPVVGLRGAVLYRIQLESRLGADARFSPDDIIFIKAYNSTPEPDGSVKVYFLRISPDDLNRAGWNAGAFPSDKIPAPLLTAAMGSTFGMTARAYMEMEAES